MERGGGHWKGGGGGCLRLVTVPQKTCLILLGIYSTLLDCFVVF